MLLPPSLHKGSLCPPAVPNGCATAPCALRAAGWETPNQPLTHQRPTPTSLPLLLRPVMWRMPVPSLLTCTTLTCT